MKNDWSTPGELGPEAALFCFLKHERVGDGLEICGDNDLSAEFFLQKRELVRTQHGASQQLSRANYWKRCLCALPSAVSFGPIGTP